MLRKNKYPLELRRSIIMRHVEQGESITELAKEIGANRNAVTTWVENYKNLGEEYFAMTGNNPYPVELKQQAVAEYNATKDVGAVCRKYRIISQKRLMLWVEKVRDGQELRSSGVDTARARPRKRRLGVTAEEVEAIVKYYREGHTLIQTAYQFGVSYEQVMEYKKTWKPVVTDKP